MLPFFFFVHQKDWGGGGGGEGGIKEGRSWIFANITHSERANATLW